MGNDVSVLKKIGPDETGFEKPCDLQTKECST